MVAANARTALAFALSPGQAHDAPQGRKLLQRLASQQDNLPLPMARAEAGNETRRLALELGCAPVVASLGPGKHPLDLAFSTDNGSQTEDPERRELHDDGREERIRNLLPGGRAQRCGGRRRSRLRRLPGGRAQRQCGPENQPTSE